MAAQNKNPKVVVKKIQPYPFAAVLDIDGLKPTIQIRMITLKGIIADMGNVIANVGREHSINFVIPTQISGILATVKVIKTYDQYREGDSHQKIVERMAEFHFLRLTKEQKEAIQSFLQKIRQV